MATDAAPPSRRDLLLSPGFSIAGEGPAAARQGDMTISPNDRRKIDAYLRRALVAESNYTKAYELDAYSRVVYRRLREFYWTMSRFVQWARQYLAGKSDGAATSFGEAPLALKQAIASEEARIFIDATNFVASGKATGIQRVVKETARHAMELGLALPVTIGAGRLAPATREAGLGDEIAPRAGDILLLLDAGWNHADDYPAMLAAFRAQGGRVVAALYDLFPLLYPGLYQQTLVADFQYWIDEAVLTSDAVVAISRSTADSYLDYARRGGVQLREGQRVGWWRLGADVVQDKAGDVSETARAIAARGAFFLGVGTVETRKAYDVALAAFETLWTEGVNANFVIVGRPGWNAESFEARLRRHKERGRRLFWLDNAGDGDLHFLYKEARAVVLTSFAEGFGLPLVEAAQCGAPVIASDIPVFREIGGDGASYFDLLDPSSLAERVRDALSAPKVSPDLPIPTWRESTIELMTMLRNGAYQSSHAAARTSA
ncbi:MAG: glycosyltransferase family 4 protein [Methylocystis sp.]|nr:glycosyltransferase family 4 protein [Methylocystis sp.]